MILSRSARILKPNCRSTKYCHLNVSMLFVCMRYNVQNINHYFLGYLVGGISGFLAFNLGYSKIKSGSTESWTVSLKFPLLIPSSYCLGTFLFRGRHASIPYVCMIKHALHGIFYTTLSLSLSGIVSY